MKRKEGFNAYEEIKKLATIAYAPISIDVQSSIFGNDYKIIRSGSIDELMSGSSEEMRFRLNCKIKHGGTK